MSDGQSDYLAQIVNEHYRQSRAYWAERFQNDRPIVPRITEYGRLMYEGDLGLPINTTPAYFWLGKDAEASDAGIR